MGSWCYPLLHDLRKIPISRRHSPGYIWQGAGLLVYSLDASWFRTLFFPTFLTAFLSFSQIVNNPISLPDDMNPLLKNLLEGLLCKGLSFVPLDIFILPFYCDYSSLTTPAFLNKKCLCTDPTQRMTLESVAQHEWVIGDEGPIPQHSCWCQHKTSHKDTCDASLNNTPTWCQLENVLWLLFPVLTF